MTISKKEVPFIENYVKSKNLSDADKSRKQATKIFSAIKVKARHMTTEASGQIEDAINNIEIYEDAFENSKTTSNTNFENILNSMNNIEEGKAELKRAKAALANINKLCTELGIDNKKTS